MLVGRNAWWVSAWWLALGLLVPALRARAQDQVVVLQQEYTATAANTMDSHYRVMPRAGTPTNWRSPIDYASGKVHAHLDVKTKPSAAKTLYNICFEATPSYACMPYNSPPYTATGIVDFEYPFSAFYQYDQVDWSKGVKQIALILKDENQVKKQGSPDFYPTTIHITLTLIKPGATYVPPVDPMEPVDAGVPKDAGQTEPPAPTDDEDAGMGPVQVDAGKPAPRDAGQAGTGAGAGAGTAGMSGSIAGAGAMMPGNAPVMMPGPGTGAAGSGAAAGSGSAAGSGASKAKHATGGCSSVPEGGAGQPWWLVIALGAFLWVVLVRRRVGVRVSRRG